METKKSNSSLFSRQDTSDALENMPVSIIDEGELPVDCNAGSVASDAPVGVEPVLSRDDKPEEVPARSRAKSVSPPRSDEYYSCRFYTNIPIDVYLSIKHRSIVEKRPMGDIVSQVLIEQFS